MRILLVVYDYSPTRSTRALRWRYLTFPGPFGWFAGTANRQRSKRASKAGSLIIHEDEMG